MNDFNSAWDEPETIVMQPKMSNFYFNQNDNDPSQRPGQQTTYDMTSNRTNNMTEIDIDTPELAPLKPLDRLCLRQRVQFTEIFFGCERKNVYKVHGGSRDQVGEEIWTATEETDFFSRMCLGPMRPFDLVVRDEADRSVINLLRDRRVSCLTCSCPCLPCSCFMECVDIFEGQRPGILLGRIEQLRSNSLHPQFQVFNGEGEIMLKIRGPICPTFPSFCACRDVDFEVLFMDEDTAGKISKKWNGYCKEQGTMLDNFEISFRPDLDIKLKATLLGACFLIDFMYFQFLQR